MVVHERVVVVSVKKRKKGTRAEKEARGSKGYLW